MVARDGEKTMALRTPSTLDGHPEVTERRAIYKVFPASGQHKVTSHILRGLRLDYHYQPSPVQRIEPCNISSNTQ